MPHVGGHGLWFAEMDNAEDKPAGLGTVLMRMSSSGMALTERRLDGEDDQVNVGKVLLVSPRSHGDNHGA
jgi:hypothetical protein